jgi:hypothetical protein
MAISPSDPKFSPNVFCGTLKCQLKRIKVNKLFIKFLGRVQARVACLLI